MIPAAETPLGATVKFDEDPYDADYAEQEDCQNCGGEGYVWDCIDGFCINAQDGCNLCRSRCDWCNPRPTRPDTTQGASDV